MALLDRVKERTETDVDDVELQLMIDDALQAIIDRFGPNANPAAPITVTQHGGTRVIDLARPADVAHPIVVAETAHFYGYGVVTPTTLGASDYRVMNGGRTLERLIYGSFPRMSWGSLVSVTYAPVNDGNARQEAAIKLVLLDLQYQGHRSERVGDVSLSHVDFHQERERIFRNIAPRSGMFVR